MKNMEDEPTPDFEEGLEAIVNEQREAVAPILTGRIRKIMRADEKKGLRLPIMSQPKETAPTHLAPAEDWFGIEVSPDEPGESWLGITVNPKKPSDQQ